MKIVFLDAKTLGDDIDLSRFQEFGEMKIFQSTPSHEVVSRIKDAEIVVTNKILFSEEVLSECPKLRFIALTSTGTDKVDFTSAVKHNVGVANVPGYATQSVAEHTFRLLFSLLGTPGYYNTYITDGDYQKNDVFTNTAKPFWELSGKTWGIIGLGTIGKRVAEIATIFGCNVIYYSTSGKNQDDIYKRVELEDLLSASDIISIHAPLNENTKDLIASKELNLMKRSAYLINVARGGIVSEKDLVEALDTNVIAGAGLDVFTREPIDPQNPLLEVQNSEKLIMTPHIAWTSVEARHKLINEVYQNINAFLGDEERNRVVQV